MLHLDSITGELIQIAGLLSILFVTRREPIPITRGFCVWCVLALSIDVFMFRCQRPSLIQDSFNALNVMLSMGVIYENYRELGKAVLVFLVSLFK